VNLAGLLGILFPSLLKGRQMYWVACVPIICLMHVFYEGARWQVVLVYLFTLILCVIWILQRLSWSRSSGSFVSGMWLLRTGGRFFLVAFYLISLAPPVLFPVFSFPKPIGPYGIGTASFHWVDSGRQEVFSTNPKERRELMVQIWYPADHQQEGERDTYVSDAAILSEALASTLSSNGLIKLPPFVFNHFRYVRTNVLLNVPLVRSKEKFPVLIYLSGLNGFRQSGMFQVENLVSHGYVVMGIDQPYAAAVVSFPDGRFVKGLTKPQMQPLIDQSLAPLPDPPIFQGHLLPDGILPYFAQDVSFALDKLTACEQTDTVFRNKIDMERIGIFGISLGSMVAAEASLIDARLKASLLMDAAMPVNVVRQGLRQPVMFLTRTAYDMRVERALSGGWSERDIKQTLSSQREVYENAAQGSSYYVDIKGMFHINFTDAPRYSPLMSGLGLIGPIDKDKGFEIVNAYTQAFFDHTLKGLRQPLLAQTAGYSGATLYSH
jgi:hypothetical protein